jgi:hypothetical protein
MSDDDKPGRITLRPVTLPVLTPGVHNPEDAPWWEFTCDEVDPTTVVTQWMGQAAQVFGQRLANRAASGSVIVECMYMSLDGASGLYRVIAHGRRVHNYIVISRGDMVEKP